MKGSALAFLLRPKNEGKSMFFVGDLRDMNGYRVAIQSMFRVYSFDLFMVTEFFEVRKRSHTATADQCVSADM